MHKRCAYFFHCRFIRPNSNNEDVARIEFILNIILLSSIFFASMAFLQAAYDFFIEGWEYKAFPLFFLALITISFIALLILSRNGIIKIVSYAVILLYLLAISSGIYYFGVDKPQTLLSYAVIIVMAGVLLGTRFAFFITAVVSVVILISGFMQMHELNSVKTYWKLEELRISDILIFSITFNVIAIISWLSNREIENSLKRARKYEAELKIERNMLEIRVQERTRELEKAQADEMNQSLQFIEFGKLSSGLFQRFLQYVQGEYDHL